VIYHFETADGVLRVISHPEICSNAEFELDNPHIIRPEEQFELANGAWYVLQGTQRVLLQGRWKVIKGNG
jgi:hypothetical protein